MSLAAQKVIKIGFVFAVLCVGGMLFAPQVEGQACLLADFHTEPIWDCVCGSSHPDCYAECGPPGENDPCLGNGS